MPSPTTPLTSPPTIRSARFRRPTGGDLAPTRLRPRWWRELLLIALIYAAYDGSRLLVAGDLGDALRNGHDLLDAERLLRLAPEHWLNGQFTLHSWLAVPADFAYATLHYLITPIVLVWVWLRHRERYRSVRTWLGISTVLGLLGFTSMPTAPPRLLEASYGFTDSMQQHAALGWWGGDASAPKGLGHLTNQFAAMPSLHVGWALWCGLILWRLARHRTVRVAGLLYPVLISVVVMGTANHYLLDALGGCAVMGLGAVLTRPMLRLSDTVRRYVRTRLPGRAAPVVAVADGAAEPAVPVTSAAVPPAAAAEQPRVPAQQTGTADSPASSLRTR